MEMENGNGKVESMFHIRFKPQIKDFAIEYISKSPKYAISEEIGVKREGLHYHACWQTDLGKSSILKSFCDASKALGLQVARGKGNAYYGSTRECTDEAYVFKAGKIIAHKGYTDERMQELIKEGSRRFAHAIPQPVPIVADGTPQPTTVVVVKKRLTISERLIRYCEVDLKWKLGSQFDMESYTAHTAQSECAKQMTIFTRAKFNDPQAVCLLRNLLYEFADDELKAYLEKRFPEAALKYL